MNNVEAPESAAAALGPVEVSANDRAGIGSPMEPLYWLPRNISSLLDVGCNVGALLAACRRAFPHLRLAGLDINHSAIAAARKNVPDADIRQGYGFELPFGDNEFDCVTCIEVIEHVPREYRASLVAEVLRVLKPGGRFIVRCPHAGLFSFLDAQNFRFRFPSLYGRLVGQGSRDTHYEKAEEELVWHHHFTRDELVGLAGPGWRLEACRFGGLVLFPITDIVRWPFYRTNRAGHWFARAMEKVGGWELALNFGRSSYGILAVLKKPEA